MRRYRGSVFGVRWMCVVLWMVLLASLGVSPANGQEDQPDGAKLFEASCASCHGPEGEGTERGPSLEEAGEASVDLQLRTGRMPLAHPGDQAVRKAPAFDAAEIAAIVEHVGGFTDGPEIPEVDLSDADVAEGQALFVANCAACHGATANGGAAGPGALAPSLFESEPLDIAEAIITGPGEMPVFNFESEERNDIISFLVFLREHRAPGGADLGGVGPVPEGFVAWGVGVGLLTGLCLLLGSRRSAG